MATEGEVEGTCCVGHDLGSLYSKLALGFKDDRGQPKLSRVGFTGRRSDPEYPDTNSEYEFVAVAAPLSNGEVVEGRRGLWQDTWVSLKSMLLYEALAPTPAHRDDIVRLMPCGDLLLECIGSGIFTSETILDALKRHFTRLRVMALAQAERDRRRITDLILTVPNHLIPNENSKDFDRFVDLYVEIIYTVWPRHVKYRIMSEGQGVALYVCVPFVDSSSGSVQKQVQSLFEDLNKRSWIDFAIVDSGGSTVNMTSVCVWLDENGNMRNHQTWIRPGQIFGEISGSQIANDEVRKIVCKVLESAKSMGTDVRSGDLARYLQDFDRQKRKKDWNYAQMIRQRRKMQLHIDEGCQLWIDLGPRQLDDVFETAFGGGIDLVKAETRRREADKNDLAVLFSGGSFQADGLREQISGIMDEFQARSQDRRISYDFLDQPLNRSSAVSAGAALGFITMPPLQDLLPHLTIGIHEFRETTDRAGKRYYLGQSRARVLFSQGSGTRPARPIHCNIPSTSEVLYLTRRQYRIICDPSYHRARSPAQVRRLPDIMIPHENETDHGDIPPPYEIGCTLSPEDLPQGGKVRFCLEGQRLQRLIENRIDLAVVEETFPVILSCCKVDRGRPVKDPRDRKFLLCIKADVASRFPIVAQEEDWKRLSWSFWCTSCWEENGGGKVAICTECDACLCKDCFGDPVSNGHPGDHRMRTFDIDY